MHAKLALEPLNVEVIARDRWPRIYVSGRGKRVVLPAAERVRTTQGYVYADHVRDMIEEIRSGSSKGSVSLVRVEGISYIFDGHHLLAAYRSLGLDAPAFLYDLGAPDHIGPPYLYRRK